MVFSEITGFGNYCSLRPETWQMQTTYEVNKVFVSIQGHFIMTFKILQDQASGERSRDQRSSGFKFVSGYLPVFNFYPIQTFWAVLGDFQGGYGQPICFPISMKKKQKNKKQKNNNNKQNIKIKKVFLLPCRPYF